LNRFEKKFETFAWIDLVEPKKEDLKNLAIEFSLVDRIILNSMDPEHLPKYESIAGGLVLFLRVIDPHKRYKIYNIQELTTKITIIIKDSLIITLHRLDQDFIVQLREQQNISTLNRNDFLKKIIDHSLRSFDEPLNSLEQKLEKFEEKIFKGPSAQALVKEGFNIKRKASAFKKVLKFYSETFNYMGNHNEYLWTDFQAQKEYSDRLIFYIDDVAENITGLLSLHLTLEANKTNEGSYKTNEIMRILTVFSIFFLPLNFLVGLYGMNFKHMPELEHPYGYFIVLVFMALISLFIFIWVTKKGWLKDPDKV
jgi:magnesium transporter